MLLHSCYSIITNVTRVESKIKISHIIVTYVAGCYKLLKWSKIGVDMVAQMIQGCYIVVQMLRELGLKRTLCEIVF
jgi:hypothetical protein